MLAVVVHFEIKPDRIEAFREVIAGHARRSLEREPGCRQFDVAQDGANPARFCLYEVYDDEAAFQAHRAAPHMAETGKKIQDMVASRHLHTFQLLAGVPIKR
jgi:quinol monooxygenase YgiN